MGGFVGSEDCAGVAESADIFAGVEAERAEVADSACLPILERGALSLRAVFNDFDVRAIEFAEDFFMAWTSTMLP